MKISEWIALGSLLVAFSAIIVPSITSVINNRYLLKMKRLEYEHADKLEREAHEREIYEGYVRAAGAYIQSRGSEAAADFGSHSALLDYYVPEDLRCKLQELERIIKHDNSAAKAALLAEIVTGLRQLRM